MDLQSWGHFPIAVDQKNYSIPNRISQISPNMNSSFLPRGMGRSYGDVCLNAGQTLITTGQLNHFIEFDKETGLLSCESGVSLNEILQFIVPYGWFLPVTPGTKFVTVGGAIANDVHGKNHHCAGTFGRWVTRLEILRSDGERIICDREKNVEHFRAAIGGLGLTGLILWAEIQLVKISSSWIEQIQIKFFSMKEFFQLSKELENQYEYVVSWIDSLYQGTDIRGLLIAGRFTQSKENSSDRFKIHSQGTRLKTIPFNFPRMAINSITVKTFNQLYFNKNLALKKTSVVHYDSFFYPLDSIHHWNRIYGSAGFIQFQFVIPVEQDNGQALIEILSLLKKSKKGSFLAVLKSFSDFKAEGLLSFPRPGVTLALDFKNTGTSLHQTIAECTKIVKSHHGAVYPAKDALMARSDFLDFYPKVSEFKKWVDPKFSSSFWRRVT